MLECMEIWTQLRIYQLTIESEKGWKCALLWTCSVRSKYLKLALCFPFLARRYSQASFLWFVDLVWLPYPHPATFPHLFLNTTRAENKSKKPSTSLVKIRTVRPFTNYHHRQNTGDHKAQLWVRGGDDLTPVGSAFASLHLVSSCSTSENCWILSFKKRSNWYFNHRGDIVYS